MQPDQRSTLDQVRGLHALAIERGMYDAAEWIEQRMPVNSGYAALTVNRLVTVQRHEPDSS